MTMTAEQAAAQIERAYGVYKTQYGTDTPWMSIAEVANRVDLNETDMLLGIKHLTRHAGFVAIPESNQKTLTAEQHATAVWIGGQYKHHIGRC